MGTRPSSRHLGRTRLSLAWLGWARDALGTGVGESGPDLGALTDLRTPWCVHVVATLKIADHVADGVTAIDDLAAAAGCDAYALHNVLGHLVSRGVFEEPATR